MNYEHDDFDVSQFGGIEVTVIGQLGDETWRLGSAIVEDGTGIDRLINMVEHEKDEWDSFIYEVKTVRPISNLIRNE